MYQQGKKLLRSREEWERTSFELFYAVVISIFPCDPLDFLTWAEKLSLVSGSVKILQQ